MFGLKPPDPKPSCRTVYRISEGVLEGGTTEVTIHGVRALIEPKIPVYSSCEHWVKSIFENAGCHRAKIGIFQNVLL
jgi:hypothetical protein